MTRQLMKLAVVSAALLFGSASYSAYAGPVGGVTGAAGGAVHGVTGAVGNVANGVTGAAGGLTGGGGAPGGATASVNGLTGAGGDLAPNGKVQLLGPSDLADAHAKSNLLNGINARLLVMSKKNLVKLCLNVGGGSGCGNGTRNTVLGLIDSRIGLFSTQSLASLCVSVGGGCGGGGSGGGGSGSGGGGSAGSPGSIRAGETVASLSNEDQMSLKIKCANVLRHVASYNSSIVAVCRFVKGM